nr:Os12g0521101 [Ipomoea trifida]
MFHYSSSLDLPRMMLQLMSQMVSKLRPPMHHLSENCSQNLRQHRKNINFKQNHRRHARTHSSAIHKCKPFLRLQLEEPALDSGELERLLRREGLSVGSHRLGIRAAGEQSGDVG